MNDGQEIAGAAMPADGVPRHRHAARAGRWLLTNLLAERERWALWSPVLLGAGIALYFALRVEPASWIGAAGCALAAALLLAGRHRPMLAAIGLAGLLASGGFAAAQLRTALLAGPMLARDIKPVTVTGRVRQVEPLPKGQGLSRNAGSHGVTR